MAKETITLYQYRVEGNDFIGVLGEEKILVDPFVTCLWPQSEDELSDADREWAQRKEGNQYTFSGHWTVPHKGMRVFLPSGIYENPQTS